MPAGKAIAADELKALLPDFEEPEQTVLDRSTLELWATCPFLAWCNETGKVQVQNNLMAAGNEIHRAISSTIQWFIDNDGLAEQFGGVRGNIADWLEGELRASRPDVQPQAIAGARASLWSFAEFLSSIRPSNILHFDGGLEEKSGQLAVDLDGLGVRVTSELDLVLASESVFVLRVVDWKSGWKYHSLADVKQSFQFQMHGDLLFEKYPKVEAVDYVVWDTRRNHRTYAVQFERKDQPAFRSRVRQAAATRGQWFDNPPAWPTVERCECCPAAQLCPEASEIEKNNTSDPTAVLGQLIATEARYEKLKKWLTKYVDSNDGKPVVLENHAFGRRNKTERKPTAQIYQLTVQPNSGAESEESP